MKAFRRFTWFGSFVALGTGLAICVGVSIGPPADPPTKPTKQLVAWAITPDDPPETRREPSGREPASPAPKTAVPSSPVVVTPSGLFGAEYSPRIDDLLAQTGNPKLESALEYLQRRMTPATPPPPTAAPPVPAETIPAPPAKSPPAPDNSPAAASREKPAGNTVRTVNSSAKPMMKADPQGDGKLSIHIQNSDLREVLDLLSEQGGLNILAGKEVQGKVSATLNGVDIQSALDAILKSTGYASRRQGKFIFVGTPEEFNTIEQALDRVTTRVYRPNYVTAAELKTLVTPLLTEKIGMVSISSPAEAGIAANDSTVGGDKFAGSDVVLVRDYEAVLTQIDQMVAEVDVRPLQVSIEAMILSVKLDDTDKFGVNFELLRDHMKFGWGTPLSAIKDFKFDTGGLKFGYLDSNVGAFVDALETISDTNVIATPRLMVLNKHRAEILIGEKTGYISTTVTETSSTQSVDFLETGAQLRLRPFISRDGLIRMEVHPELSDGGVTVSGTLTLPHKTVTEVTTNIMVRDGCTVVIGGLMKEQLENSTAAVPLLGSMPWIGPLFRTSTQKTQRQELIVLITPRIIYEPATCQEGDKVGGEFHRRQAVVAEKMNPLGKRFIARRYFRLAQAAWDKGDRDTALRFAELAVHFDPQNRAAIDLRADIWQGKCAGDHTLNAAVAIPAGPGLVDGPEIADWVLNDLKQESPTPQATPLHPLDPGQPGLHKELVRPRSLP